MTYYAAVEAGGTKVVSAVFDGSGEQLSSHRVATTSPQQTLNAVARFFELQRAEGIAVDYLGIASFGPLSLSPDSADYGHITNTPKPGWSGTDILGDLSTALGVSGLIDTDVNAAALAEQRLGAGKGDDVVIYVTIGTGIGGGVVIKGQPLHGLIHPEIGHMLIRSDKHISGICPFHTNCLEGLASGTAMREIWKVPAEQLAATHPAWEFETDCLAQMCHNLMLTYSPQRIILGGGVMASAELIAKVVTKTGQLLNGYLKLPPAHALSDVIVAPGLSVHSGITGAYLLARQAEERTSTAGS